MLSVKMKDKMLVEKKVRSTVYGLQSKMTVELLYIKKVNVPINVRNIAKATMFKYLKCIACYNIFRVGTFTCQQLDINPVSTTNIETFLIYDTF